MAATLSRALIGALVTGLLVSGLPNAPRAVADPIDGGPLTSDQAQAAAIASGKDVVATADTTETRLVTAHPDGKFTQEISLVPERVKNSSGGWVGTDPTLVRGAGGRLSARSGVTSSSVSAGGTAPLVRVQNDAGQFFELKWSQPLPNPVVSGNTAVYLEALPGVDLVAISSAVGFSTYFVVKDRAAAARLTEANMAFTWTASAGLKPRATKTAFQVVDQVGNVAFDAPALAMWDSADVPTHQRGSSDVVTAGGDSKRTGLAVAITGDKLVLAPDRQLMQDANTVYPVVIDPASTNPARAMWAMVWSNGLTFRNSATENARVGYDGWSGNKVSRAFYRFGVGGLLNTSVVSATLTARQVHSPGFTCKTSGTSPGVIAYRSAAFSVDTISWASKPAAITDLSTSTLEAGNSGSCPGVDQEWNVTGGVQAEVAANSGTLTLGLRSANEGDKYGWRQYDNTTTAFASYPKLVVQYYGQAATPKSFSVKQTPTLGLVNGYVTAPGKAYLSSTVTKPAGVAEAAPAYYITNKATGVVTTVGGPSFRRRASQPSFPGCWPTVPIRSSPAPVSG